MRKVWISMGLAAVLVTGLIFLLLRSRTGRESEPDPVSTVVKKAAAVPGRTSPVLPRKAAPTSGANERIDAAPASGSPFLSGRIFHSKDQPVEGARVAVLPYRGEGGFGGFEEVFRARVQGRASSLNEPIGQAVSGPDGAYAVVVDPFPAPGQYQVAVRSAGFYPREEVWLFEGQPGKLDFVLDEGGETIEGVVMDNSGQPISGARVEADRDDDDQPGGGFFRGGGGGGERPADRTLTGESGEFVLSVAPGRYQIAARADGFARESVSGIESGSRDVVVALGPARNIRGRVTDQNGAPVAAAAVAVFRGDERFGGRGGPGGPGDRGGPGGAPASRIRRLLTNPAGSAETDADGQFLVTDLSIESFSLQVERSGFEVGGASGKLPEQGEGPPVAVTLKPGGILTGTVQDESGAPVAGVLVAVSREEEDEEEGRRGRRSRGAGELTAREQGAGDQFSAGRNSAAGEGAAAPNSGETNSGRGRRGRDQSAMAFFRAENMTETDREGRFRFDTIARAVYTLSARSDRHVPKIEESIRVQEQPIDVVVKLDPGLKLTGKVVHSVSGEAVALASVRLGITDSDRRTVKSDAEGKYEVQGLSPGRIREARVAAVGFTSLYESGLEVVAGSPEQTHDFALEPAVVVSGKVLGVDGAPVANAQVRLASVEGEEPNLGGLENGAGNGDDPSERFGSMRRRRESETRGRTNGEGIFTFQNVNAQTSCRIIITHPDYREFRSEPFPVPAGARIDNLVYHLQAGGRIVVLVLQPDSTPGKDIRVNLEREREANTEDAGESDRRRMFQERRNDRVSRTTNREGNASFGGLDGALYTVEVRASTFQPFRQRGVAVVENQIANLTVSLLPENVISGTVTDTAGAPIASARLSATPLAAAAEGEDASGGRRQFQFPGRGGDQGARASSESDGAFRLGSLGAGPYQLRVSAEGFATRSLDSVTVNDPLAVVLERLGAIEGQVLMAETGEPVQRFNVQIRSDGDPRRRTRGGADLAAGGLAAAGLGGAGSSGGGPDGAGGGGLEQRAGFRGGFGGGASGGGGGEGGGGRFGAGGGREGGRRGAGQEVNHPSGVFALRDIDPGTYRVRVEVQGLPPREVSARVLEGATTSVQVLFYEGIVVSGLVTSLQTNEPLANAEVSVVPAPEEETESAPATGLGRGSQLRKTQEKSSAADQESLRGRARRSTRAVVEAVTTGDTGFFNIAGVPPGKYVLVVNHPDFLVTQEPFEILAEGLARQLQIALPPGEDLTGAIVDADGTAAAGVAITARDDAGFQKRTQTDTLGKYLLRGLRTGTHNLMIVSGGRPDRAQVEVKKGENRFDFRRSAPAR